jgi:hypothetical protein
MTLAFVPHTLLDDTIELESASQSSTLAQKQEEQGKEGETEQAAGERL